MKMAIAVAVGMVMVLATGCKSTTWNMKQALYRSGGDVTGVVALDQGVNKAELIAFTEGLVKLIETETITKVDFEVQVNKLAAGKYGEYVQRLFDALNDEYDADGLLPPEVKQALLSFVRDGALYGMKLYDETKPKKVK